TGENSPLNPSERVETEMRWASPDYFRTMEITLVDGRDFSDGDVEGTQPVAVVDETFARRVYPNESPIGKRIKRGGPNSTRPWKTIVGVVRQVRNQRLDSTSLPQAYFPVFQEADEMFNLSFALRARSGEPLALAPSVRAAVASVDRDQPVFDVKPLSQIVADSISMRRLSLLLLCVYAVVAVLLAASGIYGVMAYAVAQRTHEIGIRMAVGAQAGDVLRLVLVEGLKLTSAGVAVGCLAGMGLMRLLMKLLYEVEPADPLTFAGVSVLLIVIALLACWVPGRRATKIDPLVALRQE
ncbi:MAG TPA: FtsX-like permease family protein, partial [Blastocatellia bacterium]|nr:FtsX-like permease family protein [Blastocatellia bacterium]